MDEFSAAAAGFNRGTPANLSALMTASNQQFMPNMAPSAGRLLFFISVPYDMSSLVQKKMRMVYKRCTVQSFKDMYFVKECCYISNFYSNDVIFIVISKAYGWVKCLLSLSVHYQFYIEGQMGVYIYRGWFLLGLNFG